jgi:L-ascorbate metabolism protein UlaG (beta-lactamase superfamily)
MNILKCILCVIIFLFLSSCNTSISQKVDTTPEQNITSNTGTMESVQISQNEILTASGYSLMLKEEIVQIFPISHATFVAEWGSEVIYVDPAEALEAYTLYKKPTLVLVTHEHGDHFNLEVLETLVQEGVKLIVNPGVYEKLSPRLQTLALSMKNGDAQEISGLKIEAVPAYNIREEAKNFHPQGRDNGYILERNTARMYISGDSEDTPEMRALTDIDLAFVSMNLPFTMPLESAVS